MLALTRINESNPHGKNQSCPLPSEIINKIFTPMVRVRIRHQRVSYWSILDYVQVLGRCFQNRITQCGEVYNIWIFDIKVYTLHLSFGLTFSCREAENKKHIILRSTRHKFFNKRARTKLLQIVCEVTKIITCSHFRGNVYILNEDNTVCITVQDRLPQFTQVLV